MCECPSWSLSVIVRNKAGVWMYGPYPPGSRPGIAHGLIYSICLKTHALWIKPTSLRKCQTDSECGGELKRSLQMLHPIGPTVPGSWPPCSGPGGVHVCPGRAPTSGSKWYRKRGGDCGRSRSPSRPCLSLPISPVDLFAQMLFPMMILS